MTVAASAMTGVPFAASSSRARALASTSAWAGVCLWVLAVPFEGTRPLVRFPGQSISSAEAALLAVFLFWAASVTASLPAGDWRETVSALRTRLTLPWAAFILAMLVAAWVAPVERTNAVHMAGRLGLAFGVFLITVDGVTSRERLNGVFVAAAVAGAVVSVLAALEFLGVPSILRLLTAFRPGIAVVGAQVRAAGPFQYPTIASMYLEILFPLALALMLAAVEKRNRVGIWSAGLVLALIAEALILTFTRSGLITLGISLLIAFAWRWRERRLDAGVKAIGVVAAVLVVELLSSRSLTDVRLRMTTEGQGAWFHAAVDAPSDLSLGTGALTTVPITLTNTGLATWDSHAQHPVRLSYHWLLPDVDRSIDFDGLRTNFLAEVAPGGVVTIAARVRAPRKPGQYRLMWDVVQEDRLWFSSQVDAESTITNARVSGADTSAGANWAAHDMWMPTVHARPGRLVLWRAGIRMWRDHPVFGVGPDNYRLLYGPYAALVNPDTRVHSNNMYLEILIGGGLVGALAFAWLCRGVAGTLGELIRNGARGELAPFSAALVAAAVAIGAHGITDSFLSFTATYVLFSITLGLAVCCARLAAPHAHRV
jgi:hypothetical protein